MLNAKRTTLKVIGAAAVMGSALLAADASANLKIELIATGVTGGGTVSADGKSVTGVSAGSVVTYSVVAEITGATVTNPGIQSAAGGVYSTSGAGSINGNLTHTNTANFQTGAYSNGTPFADANGATQVGPTTGPTTINNATAGRISYLAAAVIDGSSVVLGTGSYTVTSLNNASSTSLSFKIATTTATNKNPLWRETGSTATFSASNGTIDAAAPLVVSGGSVSNNPTLTLTAAAGTADVTVTGNGNGYKPASVSFTGAAAGSKFIAFTPANPGTVIVGLDLAGTSSDIAALITKLGLTANPSGLFYGLGSSYDAIATFTVPAGGSFNLAWTNFGSVTLQGVAAIPEPTSAMGLLGVAALAGRRRRA
jgi:MYXO-CTERM domain-containing protein